MKSYMNVVSLSRDILLYCIHPSWDAVRCLCDEVSQVDDVGVVT